MLFRKITGLMGALVAVVLSSTAFPKEINWTKVSPDPTATKLSCIASSSDGQKIVTGEESGFLWTSSDGGNTWTKRDTSGTGKKLQNTSLACSYDGSIIICGAGSQTYISIDSGETWSIHDLSSSSLAMSSDGTIMISGGDDDYINISTNSGATWLKNETAGERQWNSVCCSSDGMKIYACGGVFPSRPTIFFSSDCGNTWQSKIMGNFSITYIGTNSNGSKIVATEGASMNILVSNNNFEDCYVNSLWPYEGGSVSLSASGNEILVDIERLGLALSMDGGQSFDNYYFYGFVPLYYYDHSCNISSDGTKLFSCGYDENNNNIGCILIGEVQGSSEDYTLTVSDGTGTGNYNSGDYATITANEPPSGKVFDKWTGFNVQSPFSKTTVLQMPSKDTGVTATYKDVITYALTVVSGSGSGSYAAGESVIISADDPPSGQVFNAWTDFQVTNPSSSTTTLAMPANAVTVTATFRSQSDTTYTLTVENGSGSGTYSSGTVITIKANPPDAGKIFSQWTGATVTDPALQETTITMPDTNTTVTATYYDIGWTPKVKFTSGHKENAKGEKESYSVNASFKFPEGGTVTPITFMNSQTKVVISLGNWQYSGTLGDDPKAKFTDKKGASKQAAINGDNVSIQWSSKKINITVKSNQGMNSGQNILDLSGQTGDINGTLENCIISFDDIAWNGSVNYAGKAKIDKKNYQSWNVKVK